MSKMKSMLQGDETLDFPSRYAAFSPHPFPKLKAGWSVTRITPIKSHVTITRAEEEARML